MVKHVEIEEFLMGEAIIVTPELPKHIHKAESRPENKSGLTHMVSHIERGRHLAELEEARGVLLQVQEGDGCCIAAFSFGNIELPADLAIRLRKLVGKKVGILRLEGIHVRKL